MNQINFIKLDNILNTKTNTKPNNNIINILNKINLNNNLNNIYIGPIINNKPSNNSYLITKNNLLIQGFFDSNINNIQNCNIELDDLILKGNILNQYFNNGTIIYKNTDEKFIGEFNKHGIPNGYCKYINDQNKITYDGYWLDGHFNGQGDYKNDEIHFIGIFENNLFNGLGKIIYYNDYSYEGYFSNGLKHGVGKLINYKDNNKEYYVEALNDEFVIKISFIEKQIQDLKNENNSLNKLLKHNDITIKNNHDNLNKLNKELEEKNKINEQLEKKGKCVVCFTEDSNVLLPCTHLCLCSACELHIRAYSDRKCPICRKRYVVAALKKAIIS